MRHAYTGLILLMLFASGLVLGLLMGSAIHAPYSAPTDQARAGDTGITLHLDNHTDVNGAQLQ